MKIDHFSPTLRRAAEHFEFLLGVALAVAVFLAGFAAMS